MIATSILRVVSHLFINWVCSFYTLVHVQYQQKNLRKSENTFLKLFVVKVRL
jgi:hypothetical protein